MTRLLGAYRIVDIARGAVLPAGVDGVGVAVELASAVPLGVLGVGVLLGVLLGVAAVLGVAVALVVVTGVVAGVLVLGEDPKPGISPGFAKVRPQTTSPMSARPIKM